MQIAPPVRVAPYATKVAPPWEFAVRYGAAYCCTLIAVAAAQLVAPTRFALLLALVTLGGLPLSLLLRWTMPRGRRYRIGRTVINGVILLITTGATFFFLADAMADLQRRSTGLPGIYSPRFYNYLWVHLGAGEWVQLFMEVILIFAVCRCLAIINDKDAVLCAVSTFPVLLLLIVVHKGSEVVVYFLLWALLSAVLFALDHRAEARLGVTGYVPSLVPGQDVTLSTRSLAGVMIFSLVCAVALSYTLTSRDADRHGPHEGWIGQLIARLTQYAFDLPDVSVNAGPERQIDFSAAPTLPTQAELWEVQTRALDDQTIRPLYWRLFTLAEYNGSTWTQASGAFRGTGYSDQVPLQPLDSGAWPFPLQNRFFTRQGENRERSLNPPRPLGYDLARHIRGGDQEAFNYGAPVVRVFQQVQAKMPNVGYVPGLPVIRALRMRGARRPQSIAAHTDSSVLIGILRPEDSTQMISAVAPGDAYGLPGSPPLNRGQRLNPRARLTEEQRRLYLQLPPTLPPGCRLRRVAQDEVAKAGAEDSDYARAKRLELYVRCSATYTLRPPAIPADRDAADYFLFSSRRGYCTHFASALTVLCRAAGMPARVVSGFATPDSQPGHGPAVLREANAHAWTEVWVPDWGWATLDGTPPDDRGENAPGWWDNWSDLLGSVLNASWSWTQNHRLALGILLTCVVGATAPLTWQRRSLSGWRMPGPRLFLSESADSSARRSVLAAYSRAARMLSRRFRRRTSWETPVEWLEAAEAALNLRDPQPLRLLTELYLQAQYSPYLVGPDAMAAARAALAQLSWQRRPQPRTGTARPARDSPGSAS